MFVHLSSPVFLYLPLGSASRVDQLLACGVAALAFFCRDALSISISHWLATLLRFLAIIIVTIIATITIITIITIIAIITIITIIIIHAVAPSKRCFVFVLRLRPLCTYALVRVRARALVVCFCFWHL